MYTGYFAKTKEYKAAGLVPVAICGKVPTWFNGPTYGKLAPILEMFVEWKHGKMESLEEDHKGDNEWYTIRYSEEVLKKLEAKKVVEELEKLTGVDQSKIVLMCYEKPEDFCHRHIAAGWLNANGVKCLEYTVPSEPKSLLEEFML